MAVTEAGAIWQSRRFVQEDAKRAPKQDCCQSSSSSTSKLIDTGLPSVVDEADYPPGAVMPLNRIPSYTNISADTRWCLQQHPSYGYQSDLISEQLSTADIEKETLISGTFDSTCKFCGAQLEKGINGVSQVIGDTTEYNFHVYSKGIANDARKDSYVGNTSRELDVCEGVKEHYCVADMDPDKSTISKNMEELCSCSEASWVACEKTEPWWRVTRRNELASFVAQKSLGCIENCDLPPPQKHVKMDLSACIECTECDDKCPSPLDSEDHTHESSSPSMYIPATRGTQERGRLLTLSEESNLPYNSDELLSSCTTCKDTTDGQKVFESEPTKAQLLEALCHSQTRAREAEEAAKQASAETERVVKLFFREASQLSAYKRWIQLLQLEATHSRKEKYGQKISDDHLALLPRIANEARKLESGQNVAKERQGTGCRRSHDMTDFAVAFALGLSLVGAGLILGWTVGCLLRSFDSVSHCLEIGVTPVS